MSKYIFFVCMIFYSNLCVEVNAFGLNRMGFEAVELYHKIPNNFRDEVSDVCVLNACSHSALLSEARSIFNGISHKTEKVITTMVCLFAKLIAFLL